MTAERSVSGATICLVGINYAPESTGIAPYTTVMARKLAAAGATVRVITGVPHYPQWAVQDARYRSPGPWREQDGDVDVLRVAHHVPPRADLQGRGRMEFDFWRRARAIVRRTSADAIVAVTPSLSGLAAAVSGAKGRPVGAIVQDLTGLGAAESGSTGRGVAQVLGAVEVALLRRTVATGVIAPRFAELLGEAGVPPERIVDLPNFTHIVPSAVDRAAARRALGWPENALLAVHTGNMGQKQGLGVVVDAARLAQQRGSEVTFYLVGDGNQRADLQRDAQGVPGVRFIEPLGDKEYPLALAAADVLLLTERPGVREMCLPSKLTSYSVAGRPVVASTEPDGITGRLLSETGAGLLAAPGDAGALLDAVLRIGRDAELGHRVAAAGLKLAQERYSAVAAGERYVDFVGQVLDER
ncbi:glycosyltransferase WbuB [Paraoerskovia sediminicola]|uniref:Glycosyltransferase WbuB n=1 Tax=Paraoerskovia sediminicola TaxID=1138587 RepID=A0ABN6XDA2_9CELL|nr:glycosyltransferase [Paraoerskovia sediminicola]BDZ42740.1 glycosyltransferase WbuB [Paraoerskovia sediminicola]